MGISREIRKHRRCTVRRSLTKGTNNLSGIIGTAHETRRRDSTRYFARVSLKEVATTCRDCRSRDDRTQLTNDRALARTTCQLLRFKLCCVRGAIRWCKYWQIVDTTVLRYTCNIRLTPLPILGSAVHLIEVLKERKVKRSCGNVIEFIAKFGY